MLALPFVLVGVIVVVALLVAFLYKNPGKFDSFVGISIIAGLLTGLLGLLAAVIALANGEWVGAGVCLGAAALAFGLLANAVLRD